MTNRDKFLTGTLLILIGIMAGMILMLFRQGTISFDLAEVQVTEVTRSETPFWTDEDLEKIDDKFLFKRVAKSVTPSVVYIETIISNRNREASNELDDEENPIWDRFLPPRARTVGSGILISSDGYILTNNHVVEDAVRDGINVTLDDKRSFDARIVGRDPSTDLAVIKIDASGVPAAVIGNSDKVEVGEWVLAIGNPFRLRSTVTAGIVGALSRDVQIINDEYRIESFIQTDAAINRGNSGGALVNTSGELIGVNTAIATQSGSYQGYGFAVPSNLALKVAEDLIEFGEVRRGIMGVSIQTVNARIAQRIGLEDIRGVVISGIGSNSAAEISGLRPDDVILAVNGDSVNESNQLQEKVAMFRPDDNVDLEIWREGEILTATLKLQEMERSEPVAARIENFDDEPEMESWSEIPEFGDGSGVVQREFSEPGFTLRALASPEDPEKYNIYILDVDPQSEAYMRGVEEGGELLELNGQSVVNLDDVENEIFDSIENNRSLRMKIMTRNGEIGNYKLY
jgi:Do/DeqQ family serine protease